ncbi:hypothetical protein S245_015642, partial [Arachis hypogaea]
MVNVVAAHCSFLQWLMKITAGVKPYTVEIHPGTHMRFWVPSYAISSPNLVSKPKKPVVVLLHGFCGDGIMTWQFQVASLSKHYAVYVPDFLFFGGSFTDRPNRSLEFQAECLAVGLEKLRVEKCVLVGFSYGGMVAFKMAEMYPDMVYGMVISGAVVAIKESIIMEIVNGVGFSSCSEMLMPMTVDGVKGLLSLGIHKNISFPNRFHNDFLKVMFSNRKERCELLEALLISYKHINIPIFSQRIHLLWGENDKIFKKELAHNMK